MFPVNTVVGGGGMVGIVRSEYWLAVFPVNTVVGGGWYCKVRVLGSSVPS